MNFMDISAQIKAHFRQSEGQIWLVGIVILGIIIVISLATLFYDTFGVIFSSRSQAQEIVSQQSQPEIATINQISRTPLFGPSHQSSVSRVNTNLELLGVMLATDPKKSKAIIASVGREPKIVRVDEELADGGKLYRVFENKVELQRNGQIESLFLKWDKRSSESRTPNFSGPATEVNTMPVESEQPAPAADVSTQSPSSIQTPEDWQERIKEIREKYQRQFGDTNSNPAGGGIPTFPLGPKGRNRGGM